MQSVLLSLLPSVLVLFVSNPLSHGRNEVLASPISIPRPPPGSKVVIVVGNNGSGSRNDGAYTSSTGFHGPPPMVAAESQVSEMKSMLLPPPTSHEQIKRQGHLNKQGSLLKSSSPERNNNKDNSPLAKMLPTSARHISGLPSEIFHRGKNFQSGDSTKLLPHEKQVGGPGPRIMDFRPHQPDITSDMRNNNGKLTLPIMGFTDSTNALGAGLGKPSPTPMANKLNPYTNGVAASFPPGIDPYEGFIRYAAENLETPMGNMVDYHSLEHYYGPQHPLSPYHNGKETGNLQGQPYADSFAYNNGIETSNSPPPPPLPSGGPPHSGYPRGGPPHVGHPFSRHPHGGPPHSEHPHHGGPPHSEHPHHGGPPHSEHPHHGGPPHSHHHHESPHDGPPNGEPPHDRPPHGFGEGGRRPDISEIGGDDDRGGGFRTRGNPLRGRPGGPRFSNHHSVRPQTQEHGVDHFNAPSPGLGSAPPRPNPTSDPGLYEEEHRYRSPPFESPPHGTPSYTQNHHAPPFKHPTSSVTGEGNSQHNDDDGHAPPHSQGHSPEPPDLDVFDEGPPPPESHPPVPSPPHHEGQNHLQHSPSPTELENNDGGDDSIWGILDLAEMLEKGQIPGQNSNAAPATPGNGKPQATSSGTGRVVIPIFTRPPPPRSSTGSGNSIPYDGPDEDATPPQLASLNSQKDGFPDEGHQDANDDGGFDYDDHSGNANSKPASTYGGGSLDSPEANDYGDDVYQK